MRKEPKGLKQDQSNPDHHQPHTVLLEEVERRQRNTLWPDVMVNSASVDGLLWKGSPKATRVQRVGIAIWGLLFLSVGICTLSMAHERHDMIMAVVGVFCSAVGVRITLNAFKRKPKPANRKNDDAGK
jgi:hypothetical protein